MAYDFETYRTWATSGGAGSVLDERFSARVEYGGRTIGLRNEVVCQIVSMEPDLGGLVVGNDVRIPGDLWNAHVHLAQTVELVHMRNGVCLRMYIEHIKQVCRVEGLTAVVPLEHWTVYGTGGVVVQPGYLGHVAPAPAQAVRTVVLPDESLKPAAMAQIDLSQLPRIVQPHGVLLLHPKSWSDSHLAVLRDRLAERFGVVLLARDLWETHQAAKGSWNDWPRRVAAAPQFPVLPISSTLEDRVGHGTVQLLEGLQQAARPVVVWNVREDTYHVLASWLRKDRDMSTGWQIHFA